MDFRVLGLLEVSDGDRVLALGGRRQRMVMAALLLHANRTASADWLVDAVWGEAPPVSARKTLQVYVSRLRKVLGDGVLEAHPSGYVLWALPDQVDAHLFEQLAEEGRQLLKTDPASAARALRQALALWRGMPWGELGEEPAFQPEAQRLRELRLAAVEDRIEAEAGLGQSSQLIGELRGLVAQHPWRERLSGQLMLALYRSGRQTEALRTYQDTRRLLGEELGIEPSPELQRLEEQILLHDPDLEMTASEPPAEQPVSARNPFKGLRPFTEKDAGDFFGRFELVEQLVARLGREPFVAVVGASGSGKSSVVRAGVLPALRTGALPGSGSWLVTGMRPGVHPFEALAAAFRGTDHGTHGTPNGQFVGDDLDLLRASLRVAPTDDTHVVLLIDQFEEIFVLTEDEEERARFVRNLVEAVNDPFSGLSVVITLRADFLDRALDQPGMGKLLADHMMNVLPLTASEVEEAAAGPARGVGLIVEPELIAELVGVTTRQPGVLPLLQYLLTELWESRTSGVLSKAGYLELGGLHGALSRRANETYGRLEAEDQEACRQVFLRLVALGEEGRHSQRSVLRSELETLDLSEGSLETVLDRFDEARLLSFDRDASSNLPTVELAHEALLREWPQLRGWISEAAEDLRLHRSLETEVSEWELADRDPDYLLTGSRLELYLTAQNQSAVTLTSLEQEFLDASINRDEQQRAASANRRQMELNLERRATRRLRWLVAIISVAAVVASGLTVYAMAQRSDAVASEHEARARELANAAAANLDEDPELSMLLALAAIDVSRSSGVDILREAEDALHAALGAHRLVRVLPEGADVAFLPSGHLLVGSEPPVVWDLAAASSVLTLDGISGKVLSVAVSRDGNLLAFGTVDGSVSVWDATGNEISLFGDTAEAAHTGAVTGLAFSLDATALASVSPVDRTLRVWDVGDGRLLQQISEPESSLWVIDGPLFRVAFDPSGSRIAVTGARDGTVWIYDLEAGDWDLTMTGHEPVATGVEFSPDGTRLVTGSYDGTVKTWDTVSGRELDSINSGVGSVIGMDVSQDGSLLAAGGQSGLVEVWELSDSAARQLTVLAGHDSRVEFLSFDATASHLATSAIGEETRVWDVSAHGRSEWATLEARTATFSSDGKHLALAGPGRDVSVLDVEEWDSVVEMHEAAPYVTERNDSAWATGITFSPDGKTVATASHSFGQSEGLLQLWSFSTGQLLRTLSNSTEPSESITFSPDGTRLAAAVCLAGSPAQVWDVASGALVFEVPSDGCGQAVDLGPDGRLLSVQIADTVDNVQVWDIDTGQRTIPSISHLPNFLGSAELSPDGDRLLTAGGDGRARVWDVDSGESSLRLEGHAGAVERAVWSPDGGTIATGDAAGAVRLWNATTGDLKLSLRGHTAMVVGLSYSPDGRRLASTDGDGTVRVWANDIDDLIQLASDRLTRGLTEAECASYHFDECPLQP